MKDLLEQIHFAHCRALTKYRQIGGADTPAFWKLGDLRPESFSAEELRFQLRDALLQGTFQKSHVPAFFTFVQTQAAAHSHRLWKETVIPLLAGEGPQRTILENRIGQTFETECPFRSAMREWLHDQRRASVYLKDGWHFWFVRATIGECALVGVSKEFTADFLKGLARESHRTGDFKEVVQAHFRQQISASHWSRSSEEVLRAIRALQECLVEAGTIVLQAFRQLANYVPPAEGWDLDALILKVQGANPVALPPMIRDFIRDRLEGEIGNLTLGQVVALLRKTPDCQLHTPTGRWDLSNLEPPPICHAVLWRGNQRLGSFDLTDDLGRRAEELNRLSPSQDWKLTGEFRWRLDRQRFEVTHPSRLLSQARAVLPTGATASPSLWVLTVPAEWASNFGISGGRPPTRFLLRAFPILDRESNPAIRVRSFHIPSGWNGRVCLDAASNSQDGRQTLWEGQARRGEVRLNRTLQAQPGRSTIFQVIRLTGELETESRQMSLSWPVPSLFLEGRRLQPGRHLVGSSARVSLVGTEEPYVQGNPSSVFRASLGGEMYRWDFATGSDSRSIVEVAGQRWELEFRSPLTLRAWLEPPTFAIELRPDRSRYRLTEEGIDLFFWDCPVLVLEVLGPTSSTDEMKSQMEQMRLVAGNDSDCESWINLPLSDLIQDGGHGPFRIDLREVLPSTLIEPGLDVRWLHLEDSSSSGHNLRFVQLPYTLEDMERRGPDNSGMISLTDLSEAWKPLDLWPVGDSLMPTTGQTVQTAVTVRSEADYLDYQVQGLIDLELCGIWFETKCWTLRDIQRFLGNRQLRCGIAVIPPDEDMSLQVEAVDGIVLATTNLAGPCSRDLTFAEVFPKALLEDPSLQNSWLDNPHSSLVCRQRGSERGRIEIDLRGFVTSVEEESRQGPNSLGSTQIMLRIGFQKGSTVQDDLDLLLVRIDHEPAVEVMAQRLTFLGTLFEETHRQLELPLPSPGHYQVYLRRSGEAEIMAHHDLYATAPDIQFDTSLEVFLEDYFPEVPALEQVISLFRFLQSKRKFLQGDHAPWNQLGFYSRMDAGWNETTGVVQELLGLLRGLGDSPGDSSFVTIPFVKPNHVPQEIILEVATVVLHLEQNTPAYARPCLSEWEATLDRLRMQGGLTPGAIRWAAILHRACECLQDDAPTAALVMARGADEDIWFPCHDRFLDFLANARHVDQRFPATPPMMEAR